MEEFLNMFQDDQSTSEFDKFPFIRDDTYKFGDWGNINSDDMIINDDEMKNLMFCENTSFKNEINIFKKYINMKNGYKLETKCLFCLSKPKTLQTLKEHYKKSCVVYREIEKCWLNLGLFERKMLIFMICFLTVTSDLVDDLPNLHHFLIKIFGTMFVKFSKITGMFEIPHVNNVNEPLKDIYNCSKFRYKEKNSVLDKLIKFE